MSQICNDVVMTLRMAAERSGAAPKEECSDTSFRELMEQQRPAEEAEPTEQTQAVPEEEPMAEAEEVPVISMDDPEMQEQMLLAAMATLQNPVIPVEQTVTAPQMTEAAAPVVRQNGAAEVAEPAAVEAAAVETPEMEKAPGQVETVPPVQEAEESRQVELKQEQTDKKPTEQSVSVKQTVESGETETPVFENVREVPVKVGEAAVPTEEQVETAKPVETQVREKLSQALERGESRIEIQLEPENLGRVRVELTRGQDGTLHVALRAENSQTQMLLDKDASGLQALLMRNTQQEVRVEVSNPQESQRQDFEDGRQNDRQQDNPRHAREEERRYGLDFLQQLRLGLVPLEVEGS